MPQGVRALWQKSPASAALLAREPQPFGIFNIKLMKCGGILAALELAKQLQAKFGDLLSVPSEFRGEITLKLV